MLRELAKLSGGMLFAGGYLTDRATLRTLARDEAPPTRTPRDQRRVRIAGSRGFDWRTPAELRADPRRHAARSDTGTCTSRAPQGDGARIRTVLRGLRELMDDGAPG